MKFLKFSSILLTSFLLLFFPLCCSAINPPTDRFYINDFANILSDETEQYIYDESYKLHSATKAQIVVVTVPNLEGKSLEEYSLELARSYGIGDKNENNGLLLLLALEERKFRVEVGDGLEGILPDAKTGRIQDKYIIPYLKENKWDEGILNGYKAFYQIIAEEYNLGSDVHPEEAASSGFFDTGGFLLLMLQMFSIFPVAIVKNVIESKYKSKDKAKKKKVDTICFIILEAFTIFVAYSLYDSNSEITLPIFILVFFTFMNYALAFRTTATRSGHGHYSGGSSSGWSSGGSSSSSGSSGGGGSFSGGGSSRGF